jgi:hypothetical protein
VKVSKKAAVYCAVVAATTAALVPLSLQSAGAATTACGSACVSPYNELEGTGEALAVSGNNVVLAAASTTSSAEDWTAVVEGEVSAAVGADVVNSKLAYNYGSDSMIELQYAPNGVPSDQCMATPSNMMNIATTTPTLILAQCGINATTLWIQDQTNASGGYDDLINANGLITCTNVPTGTEPETCTVTNAYAEGAALTANGSKVEIAALSEVGTVVSQSQMWADFLSPSQSSALKKAATSS